MEKLRCGLRGAATYCEARGRCCEGCLEREWCRKVCLNTPEHCGRLKREMDAAAVVEMRGGGADGG